MKLKKLLNKDFWSEVLITSVLFFGVEIIFRMVSGFAIFDWATLRILLSSFILATIIEVIVSFIKKKRVRLIIISVILFIVSVYAWLQTGFRNFLGVYISLGTSSQAPAVLSYVKEFLASYHIEYYLIWIPMILYIIYLFLPKKWSKKYKKRIHIEAKGIGVLAIVLVGAFYLGTIHWDFMQNPIQMISNEFLFSSPTNSSIAVNQFGTSVYGILDVKQLLFPNHNIRTIVTNNKKDPTEYTRVFDDSAWESIIAEEKNIPFLINITEDLIKINPNFKLLIIGDGPDKEAYEKLTKEKHCENNIIFTGKVPWDDIPIYYQLANAFISASQSETQGLTIIEAMAASLPVLCIDDESFADTVINDLNGYLFKDENEAKQIILKLIKDKKLLNNMQINARNSAELHSSKYFAEKVLDVYKLAIKNRKPGYREKITNFFRKVFS